MMSSGVDHNADMLQESATVVDVRDGMALVETRSRSACSACGGGSCGTSVGERPATRSASRRIAPTDIIGFSDEYGSWNTICI